MAINYDDFFNIGRLALDAASPLPIETAYNDVGFFRRAVDIRRNGVANMPFEFNKGSEEFVNEITIDEKEIPLALDVFGLIPSWATDLDMYGAAYAILLTDELALEGEGWVRIHPSRVAPIYNHRGLVSHWQVSAQNRSLTLPVERLLYIWQPNQTSDRGNGEPLARAALTAAGVLKHSGVFQSSFFEQGALNPTIVSKEGFGKKSPAARKEEQSLFNRLFSGLNKANKVQLIDGKTTVSTLQQPLKDMALTELSKEQKETISATLGVPLSLIMSNAANYATATQDDFNFYDKAIAPFLREIIADQLNKRLFNPLGYDLTYVPTRLDAYQAIELQKSNTLNGMLDRNVISIGEYRESMGLAPIEEEIEEALEDTELPEIFGYHIDAGIVTRNEIRERLGYPPEPETNEGLLKDLQAQASVMQALTNAGIPAPEAARLVGLPAPDVNNKPDNDLINDLKRWERKAIKRFLENKHTKALEFESDVIPETLHEKIVSTLATVSSVDSVKTIFKDARMYHA
jgi:HK97 family phage portal protein